MDVKLIVVGGKHSGQEILVPRSKFFIGRAEDCHLRPGSDLVSRHHAVILVEEGFVAIRDFGSKNGTFVNGERVKAEQELKTGDHLKIGLLEFEVQLAVEVGGQKKPKVHSVQEAAARTVETAQTSTEEEVDIGDWLGEDVDSQKETQAADTQPFSATQTVGDIQIEAGADSAEKSEEDATAKEEKEKEKEKPAKIPGRFGDAKGPGAKSSVSAADDMLRKFFGRKG